MKKKRAEDRFKYYRLMLRDNLIWRLGRQPTDDEMSQEMAKARLEKYNSEMANGVVNQLRHTLPIFEAIIRKDRAQKAAAAKWKVKKKTDGKT